MEYRWDIKFLRKLFNATRNCINNFPLAAEADEEFQAQVHFLNRKLPISIIFEYVVEISIFDYFFPIANTL